MFDDWGSMSKFLKVITVIPIAIDLVIKVYKLFKEKKWVMKF